MLELMIFVAQVGFIMNILSLFVLIVYISQGDIYENQRKVEACELRNAIYISKWKGIVNRLFSLVPWVLTYYVFRVSIASHYNGKSFIETAIDEHDALYSKKKENNVPK